MTRASEKIWEPVLDTVVVSGDLELVKRGKADAWRAVQSREDPEEDAA